VHFVGLVNVQGVTEGGLGVLGPSNSTGSRRISRALGGDAAVVFAHVPLWMVYPKWGWGTDDGAKALALMNARLVTVLNGHITRRCKKSRAT